MQKKKNFYWFLSYFYIYIYTYLTAGVVISLSILLSRFSLIRLSNVISVYKKQTLLKVLTNDSTELSFKRGDKLS